MSLIKMPYEVSNEFYLKALLYGQPGIGKSTLAISAPKAVLIDCDNGVHRIAASHRVPFLPVSSYDDVLSVLSDDLAAYDTIVIDTAGKLLDYMATWIIKNNPKMGRTDGALTLQGYGVRKYEFISLLKRVSTMGKHLIFVAHELEDRNGDDKCIRPEVGGSSGGDLIKELDLVGYMEALGRKRTVSFIPCDKYYAKNSARLDDVLEIPDLANGNPNILMTRIIEKCREVLKEESEQVKEYNSLIEEITKDIKSVKTAKQANELLKRLSEYDHMWDSRVKAWVLLKIRMESLEIIYNAEKKEFEQNIPKKGKNEKTVTDAA